MKQVLALSLLCALLSGCITHYSDTFFDRAECWVSSDPTSLQPDKGMYVLTDGKEYYVELQRLREKGADFTAYGAFRGLANKSYSKSVVHGTTDLFRISEPQARYITGQSNKPAKDAEYIYTEQAEAIKARCTTKLPITRSPEAYLLHAGYRKITSPHASLYNALGYASVVVIDAPMSCLGTALSVAANAVIWPVYFIIYPEDAARDFAADFRL